MKFGKSILLLLCVCLLVSFVACSHVEKKITVVVREVGSGTREAFDGMVTDGVHFLAETDENGRIRHNTTASAVVQTKNGALLTSVASDRNAIGYLSLSSVNESVRMLSINGAFPNEAALLDGSYPLQRPYVIMTTKKLPLSARAADFLRYLQSDSVKSHVEAAGCFLPGRGESALPAFSPLSALPSGEKILLRGSTSLEKLILSAARDYAKCYGVNPDDLFDVQLEGSSVGRKAVENDTSGNVIGLSSVAVEADGINAHLLCLDAIAVVVHPSNFAVSDLSLAELYDIFCGKTQYFSAIEQGTKES
ncbi:MAG: substrate-binding domain-containing protein [Clostridia bacterium]|nr:substrate-binding domain-containing protein [Clostridia bacterium]